MYIGCSVSPTAYDYNPLQAGLCQQCISLCQKASIEVISGFNRSGSNRAWMWQVRLHLAFPKILIQKNRGGGDPFLSYCSADLESFRVT